MVWLKDKQNNSLPSKNVFPAVLTLGSTTHCVSSGYSGGVQSVLGPHGAGAGTGRLKIWQEFRRRALRTLVIARPVCGWEGYGKRHLCAQRFRNARNTIYSKKCRVWDGCSVRHLDTWDGAAVGGGGEAMDSSALPSSCLSAAPHLNWKGFASGLFLPLFLTFVFLSLKTFYFI